MLTRCVSLFYVFAGFSPLSVICCRHAAACRALRRHAMPRLYAAIFFYADYFATPLLRHIADMSLMLPPLISLHTPDAATMFR